MASNGVVWTRVHARWAVAQAGVAEMAMVLSYAEGFGVVAAGVAVTIDPPERLARRMVEETLRGDKRWTPAAHTFPAHLCKAIRFEIAAALLLHARSRGRGIPLWEARLGPAQLGNLSGIEKMGHWAGEVMSFVRANDGATIEAAIRLSSFVHTRFAPWVGTPDDEDTARITRPPGEEPGGEPQREN